MNNAAKTEAQNTQQKNRDQEGKYQAKLDAMCKCGHANGSHLATRFRNDAGKMEQPCVHHEVYGGPVCECSCFSKVRKVRK